MCAFKQAMNDKQVRVAVHQKLFRHYSATPNTLILVLRDAVEVPVGAEENLTVGNGWRRVARLAQVIHGQKFELLRIGPKNGCDASSARDIQPPGCHHDRTGVTTVFRPDQEKFELLAMNDLGEPSNATPAISDGQIFLRTDGHLYCIAEN